MTSCLPFSVLSYARRANGQESKMTQDTGLRSASIEVIKRHDQIQQQEESALTFPSSFHLHTPGHSALREVKAGSQDRNLVAGTEAETAWEAQRNTTAQLHPRFAMFAFLYNPGLPA